MRLIVCRVRESSRDPILVTQRTSPRSKISTKGKSPITRICEVVMLSPKMTLNVIDVALSITLLEDCHTPKHLVALYQKSLKDVE
jgi:hypothetical protein